jgi:hypothetical protein
MGAYPFEQAHPAAENDHQQADEAGAHENDLERVAQRGQHAA